MPNELARIFMPFGEVLKSTAKGADGKEIDIRLVKGLMTDESKDLDGQKVDYDWAKSAGLKWHSSWGNIREQHSSNAIGKSVEMAVLEKQRALDLTGRIVDAGAIVKVDEGILQGWSIGIKGARVVKDASAPNGRIVGGEIVEVSLVDHPANENCKVALVKAAKSGKLENEDQSVIEKIAEPDEEKGSPLIDHLVSRIDGGLNKPTTAPSSKQIPLPATTDGDDLDTAPGSALRRKKKPTPEIGGSQSQNAATQTPKDAEGETEKGSIIPGQSAPQMTGAGAAMNVTAPSGASAGVCPDGSCSCGGCGPACTGSCCDACDMGDQYDHRAGLPLPGNHFSDHQRVQLSAHADTFQIEEDAMSTLYRAAHPQLTALLEAGDAKAALAVLQTIETIAKGSIIASQAGGADDSDEVDVVPAPAAGRKKKVPPEAGGAGSANHAPNAEAITPTKAAEADTTKAIESEVSKAVSTALQPLMDKIEALEKRGMPGGPYLRQIGAPTEVKGEQIKASLADLRKAAEEHPDFQVRDGARQILAKLAGADA